MPQQNLLFNYKCLLFLRTTGTNASPPSARVSHVFNSAKLWEDKMLSDSSKIQQLGRN
jgi:hypothetical protein